MASQKKKEKEQDDSIGAPSAEAVVLGTEEEKPEQPSLLTPVPVAGNETGELAAQHVDESSCASSKDSWEDFVFSFQEEMQTYRRLVRLFSDGDCDVKEINEIEVRVQKLGDRLVCKWKDPKTDEVVKARAIQLLRYVATYCETHHRAQVQEAFLMFVANCIEGKYYKVIIIM